MQIFTILRNPMALTIASVKLQKTYLLMISARVSFPAALRR